MPKYLTITPTYNPISLDEYLTVPMIISETKKEQEKEFEQLEDNIGAYETYARQYPNSEASKQFLNYLDQFNSAADVFNTEGLNRNNMNTFKNLKREFKRVSMPFKQAVANYNAIYSQRQKDAGKGIIGKNVDFDYLLQHPEYNSVLDRESYTTGQTVYQTSKDLFKSLTGYDYTPKRVSSGGYTYTIQAQSYSPQEIEDAFNGVSNNPELINAVNTIKTRFNYDDLDEYNKYLLLEYAKQGAATSIKDYKIFDRKSNIVTGKKAVKENTSSTGTSTERGR